MVNRVSDDGEPSGTAGTPILSVINGNSLVNVLVIVIRYFGGILLGTGGLVRAYKESAEKVINCSKILKYVRGYEVKITLEYNNWEHFMYYCKINNFKIISTEYFEKIECIFEVEVEKFDNKSIYYNFQNIIRQKPIISDF